MTYTGHKIAHCNFWVNVLTKVVEGSLMGDQGKVSLGVVVQVGLLLCLHLNHLGSTNAMKVEINERLDDYPVQEVFMGDQARLSPQSNHAGLNTNCLALRSVEVVCAPD